MTAGSSRTGSPTGSVLRAGDTMSGELVVPDLKVTGLTGAVTATRHVGGTVSGAPTTGTFQIGDFVVTQAGNIWVCTAAGTPGTWVRAGSSWERLVTKTADETVTNDTIQNDDHLFFSIGVNEQWIAEWFVYATANNNSPDMDIAIDGPASPTLVVYGVHGARAADSVMTAFNAATAFGTEVGPIGVTNAVINGFRVVGHFVNGANAGTIRLQWAQSVLTAANTTVKAGSFLRATRVA